MAKPIIYLALLTAASAAAADDYLFPNHPEPNPPQAFRPVDEKALPGAEPNARVPTTEWVYHKTADGLHPDANEQQMVWLINNARQDPTAEGEWLAVVDGYGGNVAFGRDTYANVDLNLLKSAFAAIDPKPPLAFDRRLYEAAKSHSDYLAANNLQNHDGQLDRVNAAGFDWTAYGGNVYSYTQDGLHGHAAFNIDWTNMNPPSGMQDPPAHRKNIMSVDILFSNLGIAAVEENNNATAVGPLVVTQDFCYADSTTLDHYNTFIVGTVWEDLDKNGIYDPGEGISGATVTPDQGTFFAVTGAGGGYSIPVSNGTYVVNFSHNTYGSYQGQVTISGNSSALLDWKIAETTGCTEVGGSVTLQNISYPTETVVCNATNDITATNVTIGTSGGSNASVTLQAGNAIYLNPTFVVNQGSSFSASISAP